MGITSGKLKRKVKNIDDRIEQKKKIYFRKVIKGYRDIAKKEKRFKVLDGKLPVDRIQNEIINILKKNKKT